MTGAPGKEEMQHMTDEEKEAVSAARGEGEAREQRREFRSFAPCSWRA